MFSINWLSVTIFQYAVTKCFHFVLKNPLAFYILILVSFSSFASLFAMQNVLRGKTKFRNLSVLHN